VLVTGASGLCGAHVADRLSAQPDRFVVTTTARRSLERAGYVRHDLRAPIPDNVFPERVDAIVHCAAAVDEHAEGYTIVDDNLRAVFNLVALARARGVRTIVNLSSIAVYGSSLEAAGPIAESAGLHPTSAYGMAKLLTESLFSAAAPGIAVSHLRLAYVLAPEMPERYFIVRIARQLAASEPIEVVNADTTQLSFVEVADVARACEAALEQAAEGAFNLAADTRPTPREVIDAIATHHPHSASERHDVDRPEVRFSPSFDMTRAKALLGVETIGDPLAAIRQAAL
jgi:UDP-glucose 4-epimerase